MSGRKKSVSRQKSGGRRRGTGTTSSSRKGRPMAIVPSRIRSDNTEAQYKIEQLERKARESANAREQQYASGYVDHYNETKTQSVRDGVTKSLRRGKVEIRPQIVEVAANHAMHHGHLTARDLDSVCERPWGSNELQLYGAYAMWGEGRRMNDMDQKSFDTLAKYFPDGDFYIGYDVIYVVVVADNASPMGKTYRELSSDYSNLVGTSAKANEIKYEGPVQGEIIYRFWWD